MIFHHTGSKDTYITNKIVAGSRRATGANVGYASTIDLFKLYGESTLKGFPGSCTVGGVTSDFSGTEAQCTAGGGTYNRNLIEVSRGLIQFDLAALKTELDTMVDAAADSTLKIKLVLKDVQGTQVAPKDFTLKLFRLEKAWDEGIGDNIVSFTEEHATSWASASVGTAWTSAGGDFHLTAPTPISQTFSTGLEDLEMDVTAWVRSVWDETYTNYGWLLKFDSEETDTKSYFVKRFASRHTRNPFLRPRLECSWENYHIDDRLGFDANTANTLSIRNYSKGTPTALGSAPTLTLSSGSWSKEGITSSAVTLAGKAQTGMYQASVNMDITTGDYSGLATDLIASGSSLIQEKWYVGSVLVHSGSFTLRNPQASASSTPRDYRISVLDLKSTYTQQDVPMVRLFVRDRNLANESVRIPIELKSQIINKAYYQIKDTNSQAILIPFSDKLSPANESTRISTDANGMYFNFPVSVLPRGRTYTIDIAFYDRGKRRIYQSNQAFRVK